MLAQKARTTCLGLVASQLLGMFGKGHPSSIVKLACESSPESVDALVMRGREILEAARLAGHGHSGGSGVKSPLLPLSLSPGPAPAAGPPASVLIGSFDGAFTAPSPRANNHIT